jgi:hypothetical protein
MGWLAKIAQTALKIVSIATGFAPMLQGAVQGTPTASTVSQITDDLTKIGGVITTVETVFAAMGNQNDAPSNKMHITEYDR